MKKIISLIVLSILFITSGTIHAAETPKISVSNASGGVGDSIKVDVSLSNNPGIASYKLKLNFDNTKLIPESISGDGITSNIQQTNIDKTNMEYITAVWESATNMTEDGVLFSVSFKIISSFEDGTPLRLSYSIGDICNQDLEDVLILTSNGSVTIAQKSHSEYTISEDGKTISVVTMLDELDPNTQSQALVVAALYNESGILLSVDMTEYSSGSVENVLENNTDASYIKIFVWNKDGSMRPLTNSSERIDL